MEPKNIELTYASTVNDMLSDDWKRRLKAEYNQVSLRLAKLNNALESTGQNDIVGTLYRQFGLLQIQACAMSTYKKILEERAKLVGINL